MIDLTSAINCRNHLKERGNLPDNKNMYIGRITKEIKDIVHYDEGEIVGYTLRQSKKGLLTVEKPHTPEEIKKRRSEGNMISTFKTIVGVPREYIEQIKIE